jgi:hypothetical protein
VPPQNPVNVAIVGVSVLGVRLAYPDASVIDAEIRTLIRRVASENPTWEAPHIHSELLMLGVEWRGDLRPPGGCRARLPHPELSAVPMRIRALSASPSSRASRPTARGGRRFEERQLNEHASRPLKAKDFGGLRDTKSGTEIVFGRPDTKPGEPPKKSGTEIVFGRPSTKSGESPIASHPFFEGSTDDE